MKIDGQLFEVEEAVAPEQAIAAAVGSSPILKALNSKIAAERNGVRVEQGDYLPQITAMAQKELATNKLARPIRNCSGAAGSNRARRRR